MGNRKAKDQNKPWNRKRNISNRTSRLTREVRNIFKIYCEGEVTEPEYFKSFPVNTETDVEAVGFGMSKTSLVNHVLDLLKAERLLKGQNEYDPQRQLWIVFDYDKDGKKHEVQDYNNAIKLCESKGINVAYSNDCFELWFVLHDRYQTAALLRNAYYKILSERLECNYEKSGKSKNFSKSLYSIFKENQSVAIRNATKLMKDNSDRIFSDQNPCTTVHELVQELNKCLKP